MTAGIQVFEHDSRAWTLKRFGTSNAGIPAAKGIYILTHLTTFEGFPVQWECVYVGRSKNLRRRLDEHTLRTEVHPRLRRYIARHHDTMWIWYTSQLMSHSLEDLEESIIKHLRPRFNAIHNTAGSQSNKESET